MKRINRFDGLNTSTTDHRIMKYPNDSTYSGCCKHDLQVWHWKGRGVFSWASGATLSSLCFSYYKAKKAELVLGDGTKIIGAVLDFDPTRRYDLENRPQNLNISYCKIQQVTTNFIYKFDGQQLIPYSPTTSNIPHFGYCNLLFPNGNRYSGNWKQRNCEHIATGDFEGQGQFIWKSGVILNSKNFQIMPNGIYQAKDATLTQQDGKYINGELLYFDPESKLDENGQRIENRNDYVSRCQISESNTTNKYRFDGNTLAKIDDERDGQKVFLNQNKYVGHWKDGEINGAGVFTWTSGAYLQSDYFNADNAKSAKLVLKDGYEITGQLTKLIPQSWNDIEDHVISSNCQCVSICEICDVQSVLYRYDGTILIPIKGTGYGCGTFMNGNTYAGQWRDGQFYGQGVFTWKGGASLHSDCLQKLYYMYDYSAKDAILNIPNGDTIIGTMEGLNLLHSEDLSGLQIDTKCKYVSYCLFRSSITKFLYKFDGKTVIQESKYYQKNYVNQDSYFGQWEFDQWTGPGVFKWKCGATLHSDWFRDNHAELAVLTLKSGQQITGQVREFAPLRERGINSSIVKNEAQRVSYCKIFDVEKKILYEYDSMSLVIEKGYGYGYCTYSRRTKYFGWWQDGYWNGRGVFYWASGSMLKSKQFHKVFSKYNQYCYEEEYFSVTNCTILRCNGKRITGKLLQFDPRTIHGKYMFDESYCKIQIKTKTYEFCDDKRMKRIE